MLSTVACKENRQVVKKNKEHVDTSNFKMHLQYQNNVLHQVILQDVFLSHMELRVSFLILTLWATVAGAKQQHGEGNC